MPAVSFMVAPPALGLAEADAVDSMQHLGVIEPRLAPHLVPEPDQFEHHIRIDVSPEKVSGQAGQRAVSPALGAGLRQCLNPPLRRARCESAIAGNRAASEADEP